MLTNNKIANKRGENNINCSALLKLIERDWEKKERKKQKSNSKKISI